MTTYPCRARARAQVWVERAASSRSLTTLATVAVAKAGSDSRCTAWSCLFAIPNNVHMAEMRAAYGGIGAGPVTVPGPHARYLNVNRSGWNSSVTE